MKASRWDCTVSWGDGQAASVGGVVLEAGAGGRTERSRTGTVAGPAREGVLGAFRRVGVGREDDAAELVYVRA